MHHQSRREELLPGARADDSRVEEAVTNEQKSRIVGAVAIGSVVGGAFLDFPGFIFGAFIGLIASWMMND